MRIHRSLSGIREADERKIMSPRYRARSSLISLIVVIWLLIGVLATFQRGYFGSGDPNCSRIGTIALTVIAGPLNYLGVNPKIECQVPQPSS